MRPFVIDGVTWHSAEQYFQAMKFSDQAYREVIRAEKDGLLSFICFAIRVDVCYLVSKYLELQLCSVVTRYVVSHSVL